VQITSVEDVAAGGSNRADLVPNQASVGGGGGGYANSPGYSPRSDDGGDGGGDDFQQAPQETPPPPPEQPQPQPVAGRPAAVSGARPFGSQPFQPVQPFGNRGGNRRLPQNYSLPSNLRQPVGNVAGSNNTPFRNLNQNSDE
jgi:hypothetical protein